MLDRFHPGTLATAILVASVVSSSPVIAQSVSGADKEVGPYDPIGGTAGGFVVYPSVELELESDDNVFALPEDEVDDLITHLRPRVEALSNWNRHALIGSIEADIAKYDDATSEDYEDWTTEVAGRIDVSRDDYITLGTSYAELHEDRSSVNDEGSLEPVTYSSSVIRAGYSHTFNRLSLILNAANEQLDFDDGVDRTGAFINNQDRNRDVDTIGLRGAYEYLEGRRFFVEYIQDTIDYEQTRDDDGNLRDSDADSILAGWEFDITDLLVGEISAGVTSRDFDDPRFESVDSEAAYNIDLTWSPSRLTSFAFSGSRGISETTEASASSRINTAFSVGVTREVRRNVDLLVDLGISQNDYQQAAPNEKQDDETVNFGIGIKYFMNRNYYVTGRYDYEDRDADLDEDDYTRNVLSVLFGAQY